MPSSQLLSSVFVLCVAAATPFVVLDGRQTVLHEAALLAMILAILVTSAVCSRSQHGRHAIQSLALLAIPACSSLLIAGIFYPGFMSYDSLHALRSARNGVVDSAWPPMVSYVWRVVEVFSSDPSAMHLAQVSLLAFSVNAIVFMYSKSLSACVLFQVVYLAVPVVLGTVAVIWKDVLMTAFFVAAFACVLRLRRAREHRVVLSTIAAGLLFLGVCSRHNAITGAVPLAVYLVYGNIESMKVRGWPRWGWLCATSVVLIAGMYVAKRGLDRYSMPGLRRLAGMEHVGRGCKAMDLAGASVFLQENLLQQLNPAIDARDIQQNYDARHSNLSPIMQRIPFDERLDRAWLESWRRYPVAMCYNKFLLATHLVGAHRGQQFYVTDPGIVENEYGFHLQDSPVRDAVVAYVVRACEWTVVRPWFIYVVAWSLLVPVLACHVMSLELFLLHSSALLYLVGLILYGNAADARLAFYSTTATLLAGFVSVTSLYPCVRWPEKWRGRWFGSWRPAGKAGESITEASLGGDRMPSASGDKDGSRNLRGTVSDFGGTV